MFEFEDNINGIDGIDHINIFSKSKCELGRLLSNFAHTPFEYKPYGSFQCAEGFYFWYCTGQQFEEFRYLIGSEAKKRGSELKKYKIFNVMNEEVLGVLEGMLAAKVQCNLHIQKLLIESHLKFVHYYEYNGVRTAARGYDWLCPTYEKIREILKENIQN